MSIDQVTRDDQQTKQVDLYGGAIKIQLPKNIIDVSTFRQVPDTQEVFITTSDESGLGERSQTRQDLTERQDTENDLLKELSIIIEVLELVNLKDNLEYQEEKSNNQTVEDDDNHPRSIIKYHFDSLAHDNSSNLTTIQSIELPEDLSDFYERPSPLIESDSQGSSSSGRKQTPRPIRLYGLQSVSKFNLPDSESHQVHIWLGLWRLNGIGNNGVGTDLVLTFNLPQLPSSSSSSSHFQKSIDQANRLFQQAASSLEILDWSLFG